ncbi:MAG: DNA-directed RNA polymerase subunit K [Fervidicoccaceae archaeon]
MASIEIPSSLDEVVGPKKLTKYERARIIGARALQLSLGAPPLVDPREVGSTDPLDLAKAELERGVLPITIARRVPGRGVQLVPISWLIRSEKAEERVVAR